MSERNENLMRMDASKRTKSGSTFVVVILTIALLLIPLLIAISSIGLYTVDRARLQNIVDAAALQAAKDASRVIINDPHFGFVSLSNYPPIGKGTMAPDGEPLPVLGINTLIGTLRQNAIVAHELDNRAIDDLVATDMYALKQTQRQLSEALAASQRGDARNAPTDIQGDSVNSLANVEKLLRQSLPSNVHIDKLQLSNGWLAQGGRTTIPVPKPERLAEIKPNEMQLGEYMPFMDVQAYHKSFSFAGVGITPALVPAVDFRPADGKHINSIVKIDCDLSIENRPFGDVGKEVLDKVHFTACCEPSSQPDAGPAGVMTLRFSSGPVVGMQSWSDLLREGNFQDFQITTYDAVGGDFPRDHDARMRRTAAAIPVNTSEQFAEHLYYWLRNGHVRPRVDAVIEMVNAAFQSGPQQIYAYEFAKNGSISRRLIDHDPFPIGVTADAQTQTMIDTRIAGGVSPIIIFRDDVKNLGTTHGGKHAGQALAGSPLNWCELPEFNGDENIASGLGKGHLRTGLSIEDPYTTNSYTGVGNSVLNIFRGLNGETLAAQPRSSYYSGGLALDIEIGGTHPSMAYIDVNRMRKLKR